MAKQMVLQFGTPCDPNGPQAAHIGFDYAFMQGSDEELHVQFEGPGGDNFIPEYNVIHSCWEVQYQGRRYGFQSLGFYPVRLFTNSVQLDQKELEGFWHSPNRPSQK